MKKAYEKPMITIARFDVEEWLCNKKSGCSNPVNPGHDWTPGDPGVPGSVPCPQCSHCG